MSQFLITEEINLLLRDNDPHYHWKGRGCKVVNKENFGFCKTHDLDICKPNCGWQWDSQGDWHYGRFTPRLKNYRVLTTQEVSQIRYSELPVPEIARHFHVRESVVQRIKAETTYRKLFAESPMELNQNEAITP